MEKLVLFSITIFCIPKNLEKKGKTWKKKQHWSHILKKIISSVKIGLNLGKIEMITFISSNRCCNWSYKPFSRNCDLASHTTYVMCVNFINGGKKALTVLLEIFLRGSCRRNIFSYFIVLEVYDLGFEASRLLLTRLWQLRQSILANEILRMEYWAN